MATHAEGTRLDHLRALPRPATGSRDPGRGVHVEDVVPIHGLQGYPVRLTPVREIVGNMMLIEPGPERDLVVLNDEDDRKFQ